MSKPLKGFITYSHENTAQKDELRTRLAVMEQQNELVTWDDGQLTPGDGALQKDLLKKVTDSHLLLYLVSAVSLASENCNKELAEALKLEIRVIPIILEYCDWPPHQLSGFEVLPYKGKPITKWEDESEGWQNVVDGIRKVVEKIKSKPDSLSVKSPKHPEKIAAELDFQAGLAFQLGNFQLLLGQLDRAIEAYSQSIDFNSRANNRRASVSYLIAPRPREIELDPAHAYSNRGNAYSKKGKIDKAIQDFNTAIQLDPALAHAYYNRGTTYRQEGKYELAIQDFNRAVELEPDYARCSAYAYLDHNYAKLR